MSDMPATHGKAMAVETMIVAKSKWTDMLGDWMIKLGLKGLGEIFRDIEQCAH